MTPMFDVPEWMRGSPDLDEEPKDEHYYEVELTPIQRYALLDILNERKLPPVRITNSIINAVATGRRIGTKLIRERLNWSELEGEARRQGVSVIDILFDRAKGKDPV